MKASTILVRRIGGLLSPVDEKAAKLLRRIPPRTPIAVRILRGRSVRQNALYWRVLEMIIEATGRWRTPEELHVVIKIALGRVDIVQLLDGRRVLVPQSTSFEAMTQDEAQSFYDAAYRLLCTEIMDNISVDELLDHVAVRRAA